MNERAVNARLVYSSSVHFDGYDRFEDGLIGELKKNGKARYDALIWGITKCAEAGELLRRYYGNDPREMLTEEDWRMLLIHPRAASIAMGKLVEAINHGMQSEETEPEEGIDLTLQEFQKKTNED